MGPVSMVTGSTPARAKAWKRARGVSPRALRLLLAHDEHGRGAVGDLRGVAGRDLAVGLEGGLEVGQDLGRGVGADALVGGDAARRWRLPRRPCTATGRISRSKRPSAVARAARCWLRAPKASRSSRERSHWSAIISAEMPWDTRPPRSA